MTLAFAPPQLCHQRLRPGEAKRILPTGQLVGYYLRTPCCGGLSLVPGAWVESAWTETTWEGRTREARDDEEEAPLERIALRHPETVSHAGFACHGCGRRVAVRDNAIAVV